MAVGLVVVDPQPFFCQALAAAFDRDPELLLVGWATSELEAERLTTRHSPDLVLTELRLTAGSGLGLMRRLRGRCPVVALTREPVGDVLLDVIASGAEGCLSHDIAVDALAALVKEAGRGEFVLQRDRLRQTLRRASLVRAERFAAGSSLARLTAREREVLGLVAQGLDDRGIADRLYLSPQTARTHVGNILRKLGVHSRADAARLALAEGAGAAGLSALHIRGPELENGR